MGLFANNLRILRKEKGLNQDDIGNLFNKRPNTVGNWENGKSEPNLTELSKLADFFGVSVHSLLQEDMRRPGLPNSGESYPSQTEQREIRALSLEQKSGEGYEINHALELLHLELKKIQDKLDKISNSLNNGVHSAYIDKSSY